MKTYAYVNPSGAIVGIGMIYEESGALTPGAAAFVDSLGFDAGVIAIGDRYKPRLVVNGVDAGPDPDITTILIDTDQMPGGSGMRYDKTFRRAFRHSGNQAVHVDVPEARLICHERRRAKRAVEFSPHDEIIAKQIPGADAAAAEAARAAIRTKYEAIQAEIDAATTADQLKAILQARGL